MAKMTFPGPLTRDFHPSKPIIMTTLKLSTAKLNSASAETQNQYIGDYITATTVITGTARDQTSTVFNTAAGQFIPSVNIMLNPQNPVANNIRLQAGKQVLDIQEIRLVPPNLEQEGFINLICTYTNVYGEGEKHFAGIIARWPLIDF